MMNRPKTIITKEMLYNMEMLAVTNPAMRDILEQAKVIYALAGSPIFPVEKECDSPDADAQFESMDWNAYISSYRG